MSRRLKVVVLVALVLVALGGGGLWWYLDDDAPDEVSLEDAVGQVDVSEDGGGATPTTAGSAIEGTWDVDTESGDFDFESATGTFVGFRVDEELAGIGAATAVGRTGDVTGSFTIEGTSVTAAEFEVDLTTITTNETRRDDRVQDALETDRFPTARFTLAEPIDLGEAAADGEPVQVAAPGELTIHGVTRPVEFPLEAQLVDDTVVVVGSLDLTFADYEVEAPTSPIVLGVEDHGILELQFLLARA